MPEKRAEHAERSAQGDDEHGNHMTPISVGKRYTHVGREMHDGKGEFREGVENRIVVNKVAELLTKRCIPYVIISDPVKDTPLGERALKMKRLAQSGYFGYLHSFHSNAADFYIRDKQGKAIRKRTKAELDAIQGYCVFTTRGQNISDIIAEIHYKLVEKNFKGKWRLRPNAYSDGDNDQEADFYILRHTDLKSATPTFGAILEEWGFYTSEQDSDFIMQTRDIRAEIAALTAQNTFNFMVKYDIPT